MRSVDVEKRWWVWLRRGAGWRLTATSTTRDGAERFLQGLIRGGEAAGVVLEKGQRPAQ
jgi:hypothetical protein